jgi:hypothetical protein
MLEKKVTRKEFLVYLGMLFLTIFGISSLLKSLSKLSPTKKRLSKSSLPAGRQGFGSGAYGV